jgi:hypothetical protein
MKFDIYIKRGEQIPLLCIGQRGQVISDAPTPVHQVCEPCVVCFLIREAFCCRDSFSFELPLLRRKSFKFHQQRCSSVVVIKHGHAARHSLALPFYGAQLSVERRDVGPIVVVLL